MAFNPAKAFVSFAHAVATAAKYVATGANDLLKVANKSQALAPEVELFVGALAGPQAAKLTDLAFHALGDIANAVQKVGADASQVSAAPLSISLDAQFVQDVKDVIPVLTGILKALGSQIPAAK